MEIENLFPVIFDPHPSIVNRVIDCCLSDVVMLYIRYELIRVASSQFGPRRDKTCLRGF